MTMKNLFGDFEDFFDFSSDYKIVCLTQIRLILFRLIAFAY